MSDEEESFVILNSSPMPSIPGQNSLSSNYTSLELKVIEAEQIESSITTSLANTEVSIKSNNKQNNSSPANALQQNGASAENSLKLNGSVKGDSSLAASFIMGEINADVLKTSVYSQFPSMCSMEACAEDVVKLQNLMSEYIELKNTLAKVNTTMKQFYSKTQQWREEMQTMEQNYKQQLENCQLQIATLRNENMELKREINTKVEQIKLSDEIRGQDHKSLLTELAVKTEQISNMSVQIEKLELQQLTSFEYVPKHEYDTKEKPDYVDRLEHQRIVKQFEQQMSELLAENLDLKDVQKQYHNEIDCLKVNLTAAEELLNQSRADINLLKAKDLEKSESFTQYENDRDNMREEITLLRQQIDVYSKDFEMERAARQSLAGEKEQLLLDLRGLQRKNHGLIEETQKHVENIERNRKSLTPSSTSASTSTTSSATTAVTPVPSVTTETTTVTPTASVSAGPSPEVLFLDDDSSVQFRCPICSKSFTAFTVLSSHVNDCLDKNSS